MNSGGGRRPSNPIDGQRAIQWSMASVDPFAPEGAAPAQDKNYLRSMDPNQQVAVGQRGDHRNTDEQLRIIAAVVQWRIREKSIQRAWTVGGVHEADCISAVIGGVGEIR